MHVCECLFGYIYVRIYKQIENRKREYVDIYPYMYV